MGSTELMHVLFHDVLYRIHALSAGRSLEVVTRAVIGLSSSDVILPYPPTKVTWFYIIFSIAKFFVSVSNLIRLHQTVRILKHWESGVRN